MKPRLIVILNRVVVCGQTRDVLPLLYYLKNEFDILVLYGKKDADHIDESHLLKKFALNAQYVSSLRKTFNPLYDVIAYFKIKNIIRKFNPQIVHTNGFKSGLIGRLAAKSAKVPIIIHTYHGHFFHSYFNKFFTAVLRRLERNLNNISNIIIALSKHQANELVNIYKVVSKEKIQIIHLGFEMNELSETKVFQFKKKYCVNDNDIVIGIVGRLAAIKNISMFLKAASKLKSQTNLSLLFFVIGDGHLKKELQDLCSVQNLSWSDNGSDNDVIFTSWIQEIIPAVQSLDILALTSHNEGTPLSIIEAQLCGKPVVATNVGGVADTLINNETGFLVDANDVNAFAEKLLLLISDEPLRKQMGENAQTFAEQNFSKAAEVENFKKLYKSLLTPKNVKHSTVASASIQ